MSSDQDIPRLQDAGSSETERRLLASAADDAMPDEKLRALLQWSEGAAMASAAARAQPSWKLPVLKGLGLLALAAAAVGTFEYVSSPRSSAPTSGESARAEELVVTAPEPAMPRAESEATLPDLTPNELPSAPVAAPPPRSVAVKKPLADDVSLSEQMKFIDAARTQLRQNDPRGALRVLDDYGRRYSEPAFKEEATVLRVSAQAKAGNAAEARRLGNAFLNTHPAELYSHRVEATLRALDSEGSR